MKPDSNLLPEMSGGGGKIPPTIGRLAPSPTGGLHLGHARTFLVAWLSARGVGGQIVLRIEDLDASRVRADSVAGAMDDLLWLGLDWDVGPITQSKRRPFYQAALGRLQAQERVYPCTCSRSEIARASSAPHASDEGPSYPGTCAARTVADGELLGDRPFAWRFRLPAAKFVTWNDQIQGVLAIDPAAHGGDFVVARSDGSISYQLAVVCDDAAMGITEVLRGDDLILSTPRQIRLYEALGWMVPRFGHVPLVVGEDGRRLAKRDGSTRLSTLRERGVDPRLLIGVLAQSLGMATTVEPSMPVDWIERFDPRAIQRTPWIAPLLDEEYNSCGVKKSVAE